MSYIEGVGDEVTILFTLFIGLVFLYIAWLSTSVSDRPLVRIVVLDRARFQEFLQRFTLRHSRGTPATNTPTTATVPPDIPEVAENVPGSATASITAGSSKTTAQTSSDLPSETTAELPAEATSEELPQMETVGHIPEDMIEVPRVTQSFLDSFLSSTRSNSSESETSSLGTATVVTPPVTVDQQASPPAGEMSSAESTSHQHDPESSVDSGSDTLVTDITADDELLDGHIRVRLKYLDERQRLVQAKPEDTIGQFKRRHFSVELADNFSVRFIFRGQELREDRSTLEAYHIEDNSVIHCLLSRITQPAQPSDHHQVYNFDLGFLMFPLFAIILALMWYSRFAYRSYFSAVSTLSLVGITFLFFVALMATWRHEERPEHAN